MAKVIQIVATDATHRHFEKECVQSGEWHAAVSVDAPRTVCGIQVDGDDGYAAGAEKEGKVTCQTCKSYLRQIKAIRNWE